LGAIAGRGTIALIKRWDFELDLSVLLQDDDQQSGHEKKNREEYVGSGRVDAARQEAF
jgi:hypothetical protein